MTLITVPQLCCITRIGLMSQRKYLAPRSLCKEESPPESSQWRHKLAGSSVSFLWNLSPKYGFQLSLTPPPTSKTTAVSGYNYAEVGSIISPQLLLEKSKGLGPVQSLKQK
ncbi:hypothetical protein KIL84_014022 [Mauremys mutica]|uniref:Uncharacterized protein n=1 Tax=Mauremys mutica TaxID=74926 RepID=A0A9D3WWI3_9SAUR|nr:hypothetical protein KIL84_014022 [Mauremys mutica]